MNGLESWQQWQCVLANYSYPVDLTKFSERPNYPSWFERVIDKGDREQTIQFEESFRRAAPDNLEAWFEVVFWKLYSNKKTLGKATDIINGMKRHCSKDLWDACGGFINTPSKPNFKAFQKLVVSSPNIAVCATFPAFIAPNRFPMVDRQVAKWVIDHYLEQNRGAVDRIALEPPQLDPKKETLKIWHFSFVEQWILWCRASAHRLTQLSGFDWRPRDVEMAIFTAQRKHLNLPPIA